MRKIYILLTLCFLISKSTLAVLSWDEFQIPMGDGMTLAADVYLPDNWTSGATILIQTPYWKNLYHFGGLPIGIGFNQENMNYAIVIVDWRGFYGSASSAYPGAPTRGEDGYDVVEWIATQTWSNGKVGTWGPSALGRVQYLTAREQPPHLVCMVPQVASPTYSYQEYYPNGAARTEYLEQLDALGFGTSPTVYANPYYNGAWIFAESANNYADEITIPTCMIGGWYDHNVELMLPVFHDLQTLTPADVQNKHRLIMGPWVHGGNGSASVGSLQQGELQYPAAAGWSDSLALAFLDFYLRDIQNGWEQTPSVQYFQMGDDVWLNADAWPVNTTNDVKLFLHDENALALELPVEAIDQMLTYNPEDPSPTIGGPTLRTDLEQGPYDQATEVESRNDILVFTTNELNADVVMKGSAKVHLTLTTDVSDTDIAVRLCDVYPDGRSMLVGDGIYRLRFLAGFSQADESFLVSGTPYVVEIPFPNSAITFKQGHKIRLDISGSNYPMYNRNMNTGGEMYPNGNGDTLVNPLVAHDVFKLSTAIDNGCYLVLPVEGDIAMHTEENAVDDLNLVVYPNPAHNFLYVQMNDSKFNQGELTITDPSGRMVYRTNVNASRMKIDCQHFPCGVYEIRVVKENSILSGRIVLE